MKIRGGVLACGGIGHRAGACLLIVSLSGCVTTSGGGSFGQRIKDTFASDDPCSNNARNIGVAAGAIIGGVLGNQLGNGKAGTVIAVAAAGGLVGGLIGADMDKRRCELSKIAKQYELDMSFQPLDISTQGSTEDAKKKTDVPQGQSMVVQDLHGQDEQFLSNSDQLTPRAQEYFSAIAAQFVNAQPDPQATAEEKAQWKKTMATRRLLLIGHTDDSGSSRLNAELSERRAKTVAGLLRKQGVPDEQLYFQGAGEGYPLVSNETEQGRAQNRRVEFVEVYGDQQLQAYLASRRANYALYRPKASSTEPAERLASPRTGRQPPASAQTAQASQTMPPKQASASAKKRTATPSSATAAKTASAHATAAASSAAMSMDFGGQPLSARTAMIDLGEVSVATARPALISQAHADVPFIARCDQDRPRVIGTVKSLQDGKALRTNEHIRGLYGTTWYDSVNGNLVLMNKVFLLRDGTIPSLPQVKFYADYTDKQHGQAKPVWQGQAEVNVYQGSKGILYRVFTGPDAPAQCLDMLLPTAGGFKATEGRLLYGTPRQPYVAQFAPQADQRGRQ